MTLRSRVIEEARSWIGTNYHHAGHIKGCGVDCGNLLAAVYSRVFGIDIPSPSLFQDWYLHKDGEIYLNIIRDYCNDSEEKAPGDIVLVHFGRVFAHGGIIVDWPSQVIHANAQSNVECADFSIGPIAKREMKFFSPRAFHV